jgi:hypothetical protein
MASTPTTHVRAYDSLANRRLLPPLHRTPCGSFAGYHVGAAYVQGLHCCSGRRTAGPFGRRASRPSRSYSSSFSGSLNFIRLGGLGYPVAPLAGEKSIILRPGSGRVRSRLCLRRPGSASGTRRSLVGAVRGCESFLGGKKKDPVTLFSQCDGVNSGNDLLSRKLYKHYHRSYDVSLPCSGWERVGPSCKDHQTSERAPGV